MLPSPAALKSQLPLPPKLQARIHAWRTRAKSFVESKGIALILGPCSVHNPDAAVEYAQKLRVLSEEVQDDFFLVMRTYVEKSRTSVGWKGLLYDPHLTGQEDIATGLYTARALLIELASLGVPTAVECVDPLAALYYDDLITWAFIGARTCSAQPHRQWASSLPFPVGFKNDLQGNVQHAVHGVKVAASPQTFLYPNEEGQLSLRTSAGNPHAHIVLRGTETHSNYDARAIQEGARLLQQDALAPRLMIDCSHGNSQKQPQKQQDVFHAVLDQIERGNRAIFGLMLESYFSQGTQSPSPQAHPHLSVTDACLDWESTERLIYSRLMSSTHS